MTLLCFFIMLYDWVKNVKSLKKFKSLKNTNLLCVVLWKKFQKLDLTIVSIFSENNVFESFYEMKIILKVFRLKAIVKKLGIKEKNIKTIHRNIWPGKM